jgi:Ca2+-binding RTX toxin-like protein
MAIRTGTPDNDTLVGTADSDTITGDAGDDRLVGRGGDDFLDGGFGADTILGGGGNDLLVDGGGIDVLDGGDGIDTFQRDWTGLPADLFSLDLNLILGLQAALGGDPNDADMFTGIENYTCFGVIGGRFTGNAVANVFRTDMGQDTIYGNGGDDSLYSGGAQDRLYGGGGDDLLHGGLGRDLLIGGGGDDVFLFETRREGTDRLMDFSSNAPGDDDAIHVVAANFGDLPLGRLSAGRFAVGAGAQDLNDRFIFDTSTDSLWFDSNGSRDGGLSLLARFKDGTILSHEDIILI